MGALSEEKIRRLTAKHVEIIKLQVVAVLGAITVPLLTILVMEGVLTLNLTSDVTIPLEVAGGQVDVSAPILVQAVALVLIFERLLRLMLFGYPTVEDDYQPFGWFQ